MIRKEFERTTPEELGISSKAIIEYIDELESSQTEMHSLIIMRHGKICAEGTWEPFGRNLRHGLQSHTKTYAATAVGIAYTEGLLKLDERIIDIFPDKAPENPSENLKLLTVKDVLCMGCGMDTMPRPSEDWIREFLATPVNHKPGTTYMYNSTGSTLLGAIVREKTGLGLHDYLTPRLFNKIGINPDNLRWMCMPDGMEVGGGGLFATVDDNLRLMKLYADGGVWEGERILAEDYVKLATTNQNDSATESINNPEAFDNFLGYGFQIWMCKPEHAYRADGAMGQFTIVLPDQDMIIAITETAVGAHWAQSTLDITWNFVAKVTGDEKMKESKDHDELVKKLAHLNVGNPVCQPFSKLKDEIDGKTYTLTKGLFTPFMGSFMSGERADNIKEFGFEFDDYGFIWKLELESGRKENIRFATYGSRFSNLVGKPSDQTQLLLADAHFEGDNKLVMNSRFVETCLTDVYTMEFNGDDVKIDSDNNSAWKFFKDNIIEAKKK